jgi:hypothetical protein
MEKDKKTDSRRVDLRGDAVFSNQSAHDIISSIVPTGGHGGVQLKGVPVHEMNF